jgi:hypothetical protein
LIFWRISISFMPAFLLREVSKCPKDLEKC